MEPAGLAATMMYGDGSTNTIKHFYAGGGKAKKKSSTKEQKLACKTKKPKKK